MSRTDGRLGFVTVIHWEDMQWFIRSITPTDTDVISDSEGFIDTDLYLVEVGGIGFVFFEFKNERATYDPNNGQIKALERFAFARLHDSDRFIWVRHNAEPADGVAHMHPWHIVGWKAFVGGETYRCVGKGDESESLEQFLFEWQQSS